jgi:hypothetical protein
MVGGIGKVKLQGTSDDDGVYGTPPNKLIVGQNTMFTRQFRGQGHTLVHFSAQPKPFWSHLPVVPCLINWREIMHLTYPTKCAYAEPESVRV